MMIPATRRGACPSLHHPMATGDGLLARIAPRDASLTAGQLQALAATAHRYGNGILEISTRGNLQIRGLDAAGHARLLQSVETAGINVNTGVPILAPSLFAPQKEGLRDPLVLKALVEGRLDEAEFTKQLAPKVSIIIDAGGLVEVAGLIGDVRARACGENWQIFVGGTQKTARYVGLVKGDEQAADAIVKALKLIASSGNEARGCDLLQTDFARIVPHGSKEQPALDAVERHLSDLTGVHRLADERFMAVLALPFGSSTADQMIALAQAAQEAQADRLLPLPGKMMAITGPGEAAASVLLEKARALGFVCNKNDARLSLTICAGAPACRSALLDTRKAAQDLVDVLGKELASGIAVHVSGCGKRCARQGNIDLEVVGTPAGIEAENLARNEKRKAVIDPILHALRERLRGA